jgi:hypothetical protein
LEIVNAVPFADSEALAGLEIKIPQHEYDENPQLARWPLQYLYSLLEHAGKSARQFIESQVNLLCLLHEVRGAKAKAASRIGGVETDGGRAEERRLDGDLKEKVGEVERQWREALGEGLERCKEGVRVWLVENGGWVEGLEG